MRAERFEALGYRRDIIDRRAVADRIAAEPASVDDHLRDALARGRAAIADRLAAAPSEGREAAAATCFLHEQLVRLAFDHACGNSGCRDIALVGLGGTGRGEMAPFSDLDLLLLVRGRSAAVDDIAMRFLYLLWYLQLTVGLAGRPADEEIALVRDDMSARTALLEARWLWGEQAMAEQLFARFRREVVTGSGRDFVAAKLAERDARHERMGDSRYVVEPNVKDGKGGLRDLHTLYWIGQYVADVDRPQDLVRAGFLTAQEFRRFERAERFLWAVRCNLHLLAGRAEERLGFEHQKAIAEAMRYADRPGKSAVERFMQFYFLQAKAVGDLTGLFLAQLDEQMAQEGRRFVFPTLRRRPGKLNGFVLDRGRLSVPSPEWLSGDPVRLVEMFALAARDGLEIHPAAMRAAALDARAVDEVRDDPRANAFFLDLLTAPRKPDQALRWMNEAGVMGRFVPDFGRVVAQMQFDMYHHYTVDEHSIRAIGLLSRIERGDLADDHPLSTALFRQIASRRVLYVAVLLHDIAKGRGGDHSELGAEVALRLGPRFGLDAAETETVAWLVRHHLLMSHTAFRRDIADPKTIDDFVRAVASPERLRLLLILTVVDIRAVGPTTWTDWKRQLLRALYDAAEEKLRLGHKQRGRSERVTEKQVALADAMGWRKGIVKAFARRLQDSYWLAEPDSWQQANAAMVARSEAQFGNPVPDVECAPDPESGFTRLSFYAPDSHGLFARVTSALSEAGASIVEARIHTTRDGMALDNLLLTDRRGRGYDDVRLRNRLAKAVRKALAATSMPEAPRLAPLNARERAFRIAPSVLAVERASNRVSVIEVNARDRGGLLARMAHALSAQGAEIRSAHIATYGERAVDVFYLTEPAGQKLSPERLELVRQALLDAVADA